MVCQCVWNAITVCRPSTPLPHKMSPPILWHQSVLETSQCAVGGSRKFLLMVVPPASGHYCHPMPCGGWRLAKRRCCRRLGGISTSRGNRGIRVPVPASLSTSNYHSGAGLPDRQPTIHLVRLLHFGFANHENIHKIIFILSSSFLPL